MRKTNGFVLIELILAMGIILVLSGFIAFSLINEQKNVSMNSLVDSITSDIGGQQIKAMQGVGGQSGEAYGVYLSSNKYILFTGASYSPLDTNNFTVNLDLGIIITNISFPLNSIVFSSMSGELNDYSNGNSSFTVQDTKGTKSLTVTLNRYGVVVSEN